MRGSNAQHLAAVEAAGAATVAGQDADPATPLSAAGNLLHHPLSPLCCLQTAARERRLSVSALDWQ